ncbi:MAG: CPBP family intramembrane metalloprotease [Gammaproteobacteria bacterium]|nr:CPBP family intramembrane metalloprotease [Gammaproteobacteria bacterium]
MTRQFLIWTFSTSYLVGFIFFYLARFTDIFVHTPSLAMFILIFYMWIPALVSLVLIKHIHGERLADYGLRFRLNRGWIGAWVFPLLTGFLTIGVCLVLGIGVWDPDFSAFLADLQTQMDPQEFEQARAQLEGISLPLMAAMVVLQGIIAGTTINALAAFGEEMGWRGLLYTRLRPMGFWRANLLIGLIWGLWHAPIIAAGHNFPEYPVLGILVMTIGTIALSPLIGYVRERSGSVIAAAIYHGVFNASASVSIMMIADAPNLLRSPLGVGGIIAMALLIGLSVLLLGMGREKTSNE